MKLRIVVLLLTCATVISAALGFAAPARAEGSIAIVDQANVVDVHLFDSIQILGPAGQEFTPKLAGLDVVELFTEDFVIHNGIGADLQVRIREKTIDGPILAESLVVSLPDDFHGITQFTFPTLVRLVPGQMYVIEITVTGDSWVLVHNWGVGSGGGPYSTYEGGNWIMNGISIDGNDLWFREGLANITPQSRDYCKNDLWKSVTRSNGKAFKNQGDCIQYYNKNK